jgi:methylmalonyl-CoA mutase cobalamin-binding domain/chain
MKKLELFSVIKSSLVEFEVEKLKIKIQEALNKGITAEKIIRVLSEGMEVVGEKYQTGEYFVTSLILAGETMNEALVILEPYLSNHKEKKIGKLVMATVAGDIHDIGKNIFITLMETAGFQVVDLGVDVSAKDIIKAVKKNRPAILGLSALLTTNLEQFPIIVKMLEEEGLRENIKVIAGGATVTEEYVKKVGIDAHAKSAVDGVNICKAWMN